MSHPAPTARDERLACAGAELRLRVEGVGPPVVLVHGWALDLDAWEPQAAALRGAYRVVRYDRPGFGTSSGTPSVAADVAALACVVAHLGLERFALVASSQAGRGSLRYVLQHPGTVAALVLDGVPLEGFLPGPRAAEAPPVGELTAELASGGIDAVRRRLAANPFFRLRDPHGPHAALLERVLGRYPATDLAVAAPPDSPVNVAARLAEIATPTLVVNGAHDTAHRRLIGDAIAYGLPDARRVVVEDAGHLANLDRADAYSALLREFLDSHCAAA